jgi:hypothetical protein
MQYGKVQGTYEAYIIDSGNLILESEILERVLQITTVSFVYSRDNKNSQLFLLLVL